MRLREAAVLIAPSLRLLLELHRSSNDPQVKKYVEDAIYYMCRKMELFARPRVSIGARKKAEKRSIDLRRLTWARQAKYDGGRKVFHLDHLVTVASMRDELLSLRAVRSAAIASVLSTTAVAWILKNENRRLDKAGYRSRRDNWRRCYKKLRITLKR